MTASERDTLLPINYSITGIKDAETYMRVYDALVEYGFDVYPADEEQFQTWPYFVRIQSGKVDYAQEIYNLYPGIDYKIILGTKEGDWREKLSEQFNQKIQGI